MATVTAFTAERSLEIENTTIVSGLVDVNGDLILYSRDGNSVNAGHVKGAMPTEPGHPTPYGSATTFVRVAVIDGLSAAIGGQLVIDFSGGGAYSRLAKYSATIHVGQRGDNGIQVDVYEHGDTSGDVAWGIIQKGTYLFELWTRLPIYAGPTQLKVRQAWNATITYDSDQATTPVGWNATPVTVQKMGQKDPPGSITIFAGSTIPSGWLLCNGQAVSRINYRDLFNAILERHGAGDGSTTFNVPNLTGRVVVGVDTADADFNGIGEIGGEKTHLLTIAEMPSHNHTQNAHNHTQNAHSHRQVVTANTGGSALRNDFSADASGGIFDQGANTNATTATNNAATATNNPTGGGEAHNNVQPYMALHYIIKT